MIRKNWHSLSEYRALRAMLESTTTAAAARRLGLSQSAVSRALASLEARGGVVLFERESGRLSPTPAALRLNARLDALFQALDRIDGPTDTSREVLRIIAPPSFSSPFLIAHMASFMASNPQVFVSLEIGTSDDVIAGMVGDRFDLGIFGVELTRAGVRLMPFRKAPAACVMTPDHPLAAKKVIRPADLEGQNLVVLSYRHARRAQLDKLLNEARARPQLVAEVSDSTAAIGLVRAGRGLTIINPFPSVQIPQEGVVFRPFSSPILYQIYFTAPDHRPLSRAARQFMRHVRLHTPADDFSQALA